MQFLDPDEIEKVYRYDEVRFNQKGEEIHFKGWEDIIANMESVEFSIDYLFCIIGTSDGRFERLIYPLGCVLLKSLHIKER